MPDLAVAAFAHAAFHVPLEAHVDVVVGNAFLAHLLHDEPIHHRRPAQRAERGVGVDLEMFKRLGDQAFFAVPRLVCVVDGKIEVKILAMAPHLELVAEHHFLRRLAAVDDGDLAEVGALVVNVVDKAAKRRDAKAACHEQDVVTAHLLEGKATPERPANTHDVAALHLVERLGEAARTAHAQLDEAALRRRGRDGYRRLAHPEDGKLDELAGLMVERIADALVDQAKLEELLGRGELGDRRDTRRPRTIRVRGHALGAGHRRPGVMEGMHLDCGGCNVIRHRLPPFARRTSAPQWD